MIKQKKDASQNHQFYPFLKKSWAMLSNMSTLMWPLLGCRHVSVNSGKLNLKAISVKLGRSVGQTKFDNDYTDYCSFSAMKHGMLCKVDVRGVFVFQIFNPKLRVVINVPTKVPRGVSLRCARFCSNPRTPIWVYSGSRWTQIQLFSSRKLRTKSKLCPHEVDLELDWTFFVYFGVTS